MSKPGSRPALPSANVADMLEILADPALYQRNINELKAIRKDLDERMGQFDTLEKIQAYHKQVKVEAAEVSQSRKQADAMWAKVEQASAAVATRKQALDEEQAALDQMHTDRTAAHAREVSTHRDAVQAHEQAVTALDEARAKLRADQAKHDARVAKAKDKLAAVVQVVKGVEAL